MTGLLRHALVWGLIVSAWLTVTFIALSRLNPEMWLNDYPPDIRAKHGPMSPKANRERFLLGVPVMLVAFGLVALATIHLARAGLATGFLAVVLHTFVMMTVFNVVDLLLIDWLLFVRVRPDFVILPGTEGLAGYGDYGFHWRAFLKGTAGIAVLSVIVGGIASLVEGSNRDAAHPAYVVRDSAHIHVVENLVPAWSSEEQWRVEPDPLVDIGGGIDEATPLFRVQEIIDLGVRIAVLNAGASQVNLYDSAGVLVRRVGRRGNGPGEFAYLRAIHRCGGDSIAVDDVSRVLIFDSDGGLARTQVVEAAAGEAFRIDAGTSDCTAVLASGGWNAPPRRGVVARRYSVVFWTSLDGADRDTVGRFPGQEVVGASIEGAVQPLFLPWGIDGVRAARGDRFYFGSSDVAEVRVFVRDRGLVRVIRWPAEPRQINAADRAMYARKRTWLLERVPLDAIMPVLDDVPGLPDRKPIFRSFLIDDDSNLWVREYPDFIAGRPDLFDRDVPLRYSPPPGDIPESYWVFNPDGRWLGKVELPHDLVVRTIGRDRVIGVWKDDLDVEHVRVHRLSKTSR